MALLRGAREEGKPVVYSTIPSFNWTPGSPIPVPYPVRHDLESSVDLSEDVRYNKNWVFLLSSNTVSVTGDEAGTEGGVLSGTFTQKAEPLFSTGASSVHINGENAIRTGDIFWMNDKNTVGYLSYEESEKDTITDEGKVENAIPAPEGIIGFISSLF